MNIVLYGCVWRIWNQGCQGNTGWLLCIKKQWVFFNPGISLHKFNLISNFLVVWHKGPSDVASGTPMELMALWSPNLTWGVLLVYCWYYYEILLVLSLWKTRRRLFMWVCLHAYLVVSAHTLSTWQSGDVQLWICLWKLWESF